MSVASNWRKEVANGDTDEKHGTQCHRHLARLRWIVQSRNEPAITRGLKHRQIIGNDSPAGCLRKHINIPVAPAQLRISEKSHGAETCNQRHNDRRLLPAKPRLRLK